MRGTPVVLRNFSGGVNTKEAVYNLSPEEARDCRNVVSTSRGSIRKRNGDVTLAATSAFTASPQNVIDLFPAHTTKLAGVTTPFLVAVDYNANIHRIAADGTVTNITGAALINDQNSIIEAPTSGGQGPVYISNGLLTPQQWSGTGNIANWTANSGGGSIVPMVSFLKYFGNRVWAAGGINAANPNHLYFSGDGTGGHLADPRWWNAGSSPGAPFPAGNGPNYVAINPDDGDAIAGLGSVGPYLLVFKKRHIYVVYDMDTGANRSLSNNIGCIAPKTIAESPYGTFFLSLDQGVFITDGSSVKQISEKITPTLNGVDPTLSGAFASGVYYNDHYYLSVRVPGGGSFVGGNIVCDYDAQLQSWWFHTNPMIQYAVWLSDQVTPGLYGTNSKLNTGVSQLYVDDTLTDNGSNFTSYWKSYWISSSGMWRRRYMEEPYRNKRLRQIRVDGKGTMDVYVAKDFASAENLVANDVFGPSSSTTFGSGSTTFGSSATVYGDTTDLEEAVLPADTSSMGVARAFSVVVQQASSATPAEMEMDSVTLFLSPRQN